MSSPQVPLTMSSRTILQNSSAITMVYEPMGMTAWAVPQPSHPWARLFKIFLSQAFCVLLSCTVISNRILLPHQVALTNWQKQTAQSANSALAGDPAAVTHLRRL